jgi:hypothetical protein
VGNVGELVGKPLAQSSENAAQLSRELLLSQERNLAQNAPTQDDATLKGPRV